MDGWGEREREKGICLEDLDIANGHFLSGSERNIVGVYGLWYNMVYGLNSFGAEYGPQVGLSKYANDLSVSRENVAKYVTVHN